MGSPNRGRPNRNQVTTGSVRLMIVVAATMLLALATFANPFAAAIGFAAVGATGLVIVILLIGVLAGVGRHSGFKSSHSR